MASSLLSFLALYLLFNLTLTIQVSPELLFEDGYVVTTVIDGDNLHVNPYSVSSQHGSSNLILLDSSSSTFYTASFPTSQESSIKRLTGNGVAGYVDGDLGLATFSKPKSFAVDYKGNIYVADKGNHAIRKITQSGVTTIAGGYIQKAGRADGPAKNATFSDDFEVAFVPEQCALMVSDHGNRLVRQINLEAENCQLPSNNVLGTTSAWVLGLAFACILGVVIGFVMRPFVIPEGGQRPRPCKGIWNHSLTSLGTRAWMCCYDIKNAVVSSTLYAYSRKLMLLSLSQITLMFRIRIVEVETPCKKPVSLLDCDDLTDSYVSKSQMITDQLRDLVSFDEDLPLLSENTDNRIGQEGTDVFQGTSGKIDHMIKANMMGFAQQATQTTLAQPNLMEFAQQPTITSLPESLEGNLGLVKRR